MSLVDQIDQLFGQRFLVEMEPATGLTTGTALVSPERAMPGSQVGTIVKVAEDCPSHLHEDLRVIVSQYSGTDLNLEGELGKDRKVYKLCQPIDVIMRLAKVEQQEIPDASP